MRHTSLVVALLNIATLVLAQQEGEKAVVVADKGAELKRDSGPMVTLHRGRHVIVNKLDGDRLNVTCEHVTGWVKKTDILPVDRALSYFTEAIEKSPTAWDCVVRGLIWHSRGELDKAIADFDKAIQIDPTFAVAYGNRGMAWGDKGDNDKAIADYTEAIRLDGTVSAAYYGRGCIWHSMGQYDKAIADYTQTIRIDRNDASAFYNRSLAWKRKGESGKALGDVNEAIRLDPKHVGAYCSRGRALQGMGEYEKAIADYTQARRLDPKYWNSYASLAWLLATCPDPKFRDGVKAVADAKRACELTQWSDGNLIDTLAAAYAEAGNFQEAVKWQEKALSMCADDAKTDFQSRLDLYKSGKPYREK